MNGGTAFNTETLTALTAAISAWDGAANSAALIALGAGVSSIANFMQQVKSGGGINGLTQWFIPARYQNEMCHRNLKRSATANRTDGTGATSNIYADPNTPVYTSTTPAQTNIAAFMAGGSKAFENIRCWSSTEFPSTEARVTDMDSGYFTHYSKTSGYRRRLVRMIKI